jgi:predicted amidohydrolase YtcJ
MHHELQTLRRLGGVRLAAHVRDNITRWDPKAAGSSSSSCSSSRSGSSSSSSTAAAWASLNMVAHACEAPAQALAACEHVADVAAAALRELGPASSAGPSDSTRPGLLLLSATATDTLARLYPQMGQLNKLSALAERGLQQALAAGVVGPPTEGRAAHGSDGPGPCGHGPGREGGSAAGLTSAA